ncbi:Ring assembly protein 3 [Golovinomyces cichoracearum]|uniref:Ring assembly protein 3 n=1 Tax=Golovinomyces cichoracearum TaxID=62708 RepID=A0A420ICV7_9PEZI|nr:Ring assembly protein 3 [Golovinomyces cichoracearum]
MVLSAPSTVSGVVAQKSIEEQVKSLFKYIREQDLEEKEKCQKLNNLTKIFNDYSVLNNEPKKVNRGLSQLIDNEFLGHLLGYLDIRRSQLIRSHVILTISAFLKAADAEGGERISKYLMNFVKKGTSDDLTVAFSAAASIFPLSPDLISTLFLSEGFILKLKNLIDKKLVDDKLEQASLELLNVACMNSGCRNTIKHKFLEWLTEKAQRPAKDDPDKTVTSICQQENDLLMKQEHTELIRNLAAVILAKLQVALKAVPSTTVPGTEERIQPVSVTIEDLSERFKNLILSSSSCQTSIEGLAYTSLQPKIKESLALDKNFLRCLIKVLRDAPVRSPVIFGALSILVNLTTYKPVLPEEQKHLNQLKAYANASKVSDSDHLNDDEHVSKRCLAVFEAGSIPTLVTHTQHGTSSSLALVVSIIFSLSRTSKIRGLMAQQGAVKLLLHAFSVFSPDNLSARRTTAHALARILITTNPLHIFGGSNPLSITTAVRPLILILSDDPDVEHHDLLPVFESLLALTNLASTDDTARNLIIRLAFPQLEEFLFSKNSMVTRATVQLICNLVQSAEAVCKFADDGKQASHRMHILLALTDAEDLETRSAASGALASLTQWDKAVNSILERDRGAYLLLRLCQEDQDELRHRGLVCILNILMAPGKIGKWGVAQIKGLKGTEILMECLKKTRNQDVIDIAAEALKLLLDDKEMLNLNS